MYVCVWGSQSEAQLVVCGKGLRENGGFFGGGQLSQRLEKVDWKRDGVKGDKLS